jgi:hypothetical protein
MDTVIGKATGPLFILMPAQDSIFFRNANDALYAIQVLNL